MFEGSSFKAGVQVVNAASVLCGIGSDSFCACFPGREIPPIEYKVKNFCYLVVHLRRQFFNFFNQDFLPSHTLFLVLRERFCFQQQRRSARSCCHSIKGAPIRERLSACASVRGGAVCAGLSLRSGGCARG